MKSRILGLVIVGAGCLAALPALASPAGDGGPHARYFSIGKPDSSLWQKDLWVDPSNLDTRHETRHFGVSDFGRMNDPDWGKRHLPMPMPTPAAAPEFNQASAAVALTLLLGGLAFVRARRRRV
jgi:hypothetical protein